MGRDLLEQRARSNDREAQYELGIYYENIDLQKAFDLLMKAGSGKLKEINKKVQKELGPAAKTGEIDDWYPLLAKKGNAEALCHVGISRWEKDPPSSFQYFLSAAEGKCTKAYGYLAACYERGIGTARNIREMAGWLEAAAGCGVLSDEQYQQLGLAYLTEYKDADRAFNYFFKMKQGFFWRGLYEDFNLTDRPDNACTLVMQTLNADKITADRNAVLSYESRQEADRCYAQVPAYPDAYAELQDAFNMEQKALCALEEAKKNLAEKEVLQDALTVNELENVLQQARNKLKSWNTKNSLHTADARGFFSYVRDNTALVVVHDLKNTGSLDEMLKSAEYMRECNKLRKENGLGPCKTSYVIAALSAVCADEADISGQINHNVTACWLKGRQDPFVTWYDREKQLAESGENAVKKVGAYRAITSKDYDIIGFAISSDTRCMIFDMGSDFNRMSGYNYTSMTVDQYESELLKYKEYVERLAAEKAELTNAVDDAQKQLGKARLREKQEAEISEITAFVTEKQSEYDAAVKARKEKQASYNAMSGAESEYYVKAQYCLAVNLTDLQNLSFKHMAKEGRTDLDCDDLEQAFGIFQKLAGGVESPEQLAAAKILGVSLKTGSISDWYMSLYDSVKAKFKTAELWRKEGNAECTKLYQELWDEHRHPVAGYFGYPELKKSDLYYTTILPAAAECGVIEAEYEYGKYLQNNNTRLELSFQYLKDAAGHGNVDAMFSLGYAYGMKKGVEEDGAKAVEWYQKYVENNDSGTDTAEFNMGIIYFHGMNNLAKDYNMAYEHFMRAANYASAQDYLGLFYENGYGPVDADCAEAVKWYDRAAKQGNKFGQNHLACLLKNGRGIGVDLARAFELFTKAAKAGITTAQKEITSDIHDWYVKLVREGNEPSCSAARKKLTDEFKNTPKTIDSYYEKFLPEMAECGVIEAEYEYGKYLQNNNTRLELSFQYLKDAAGQGNVGAMFSLGYAYAEKKGVKQDGTEAVRWYQEYIKHNGTFKTISLLNIGIIYFYGRENLPKDYAIAYEYFKQAAADCNTRAQYYMGLFYENGYGVVETDYAEAANRYELSINTKHLNYVDALYHLASILKSGNGVQIDLPGAFGLFSKAAAEGSKNAEKEIGDAENLHDWYVKLIRDNAADEILHAVAAELKNNPSSEMDLVIASLLCDGEIVFESESTARLADFIRQRNVFSAAELSGETFTDPASWYEKMIGRGIDAGYNLALELENSTEVDLATAYSLLTDIRDGSVMTNAGDEISFNEWKKSFNVSETGSGKSLNRFLKFVHDKNLLCYIMNKYGTDFVPVTDSHEWSFYKLDRYLDGYIKNKQNIYHLDEGDSHFDIYHIPPLKISGEEAYDFALDFEQCGRMRKAILVFEYSASKNCHKAYYTLVNMDAKNTDYFIYIEEEFYDG